MIEIVPSILTNDPNEARMLLERAEGVVERVSVDIIDGKYADNKTIRPGVLEDVTTGLNLDFQLMVIEPVNWIEKCARSGADRIIGHVEKMSDQREFVGKVQEAGLRMGLGLDLDTPVTAIDQEILTSLDVVLLMSVSAGFGGQKFNKKVLKKIAKLDDIRVRDDTPYKIHVDGGVTTEVISDIRIKGADEVSIGQRIFDGDLEKNIKKYKRAAY
jgi:ribulose-phosphate 3-epimerase